MAVRKRASFAGIEFTGTDLFEHGINVPIPVMRKILKSDKIKILCTSNHDDTGKDENLGETSPQVLVEMLDDDPRTHRLNKDGTEILFMPHLNASYTITVR